MFGQRQMRTYPWGKLPTRLFWRIRKLEAYAPRKLEAYAPRKLEAYATGKLEACPTRKLGACTTVRNQSPLALGIAALCLLSLFGCARAMAAEPDIPIADFEGDDYGDWTVTGEAFGTGPAHGTLAHQMKVTGFEGKGLVNSYLGSDRALGTLTSPPIKV